MRIEIEKWDGLIVKHEQSLFFMRKGAFQQLINDSDESHISTWIMKALSDLIVTKKDGFGNSYQVDKCRWHVRNDSGGQE